MERLFPQDAAVMADFPWKCDFEGAIQANGQPKCAFMHGTSVEARWTERQSSTDTANTGPEQDFTGCEQLSLNSIIILIESEDVKHLSL